MQLLTLGNALKEFPTQEGAVNDHVNDRGCGAYDSSTDLIWPLPGVLDNSSASQFCWHVQLEYQITTNCKSSRACVGKGY